jgi:hypothetical protein
MQKINKETLLLMKVFHTPSMNEEEAILFKVSSLDPIDKKVSSNPIIKKISARIDKLTL